ncbi:hypothetical protein CRG98_007970 [Punica granatum]|uniref:Endonuclease/exonuclease/phosphatase domain-containing protein n=1 Tax=Punica granatum TaxID=22663 RepID=A0A2I0KT49_PUNGR|nr:hypothetical protein CRG98_007970 [Punica granatum]
MGPLLELMGTQRLPQGQPPSNALDPPGCFSEQETLAFAGNSCLSVSSWLSPLFRESAAANLPFHFVDMDYLDHHADNTSSPANFHLNILLWNFRGLNNEKACNALRDLIDTHIMIQTETRVPGCGAESVAYRLPFDRYVASMWNSGFATVDIVSSTEQEIHALVQAHNHEPNLVSFFDLYASPRLSDRLLLWENLELVPAHCNYPRIAIGDFNEVCRARRSLAVAP